MNSVTLIGRLTKDPEVRYGAESQTAVARFTIAIDRIPGKNGEKQTDFPGIVCFGKTAELVEKYVKKGQQIAVQGRLQTGSYTNKEGQKVYTTDVVADRVEFLGKGDGGEGGNSSAKASNESIPEGFSKMTEEDLPF